LVRQKDQELLQGPFSLYRDCLRVAGITAEFLRGFWRLRNVGPCVTFFGSARIPEHHPYYVMARSGAALVGQRGYAVMTGGGPGIMAAANRGARDVGALSIGCNIQLPKEQQANPYLDIVTEFQHFFIRKVMLVRYSQAFIILPGGFGTMDEIFETATLIQTGKIRKFPIVLMGSAYWSDLIGFVDNSLLPCGAIDAEDLEGVFICDDPMAAVDFVVSYIKD
jgi:uncharacterized protein (TIGR00730 family)